MQVQDVVMGQYVGDDGQALQTRCLVTRHRDLDGEIELIFRSTGFDRRYAFIGPDGIGDYPADQAYAHIAADASGVNANASYQLTVSQSSSPLLR